tara:strand:- start:9 stop:1034 length:1026 start_codon:yes stop_codon:yes gene_type:complete
MKIYKVGGAVRDKILGRKSMDNDYVVVGSSPNEMKELGYKQIGKDFPVFLHPSTNEEYALARSERKVSLGHKGFDINFNKDITLFEDLKRRDLTINAIAEDDKGNLIDPYNGVKDIKEKTIKCVSNAFSEDPLRAIRVARFMAQLDDFTIHHTTEKELLKIAKSNELKSLPKERVWDETMKSLKCNFLKFLETIKIYKLDVPWFSKLEYIPKEIQPSSQLENIWCNISKQNDYKFGENLLQKKSFFSYLEVWKQLDVFNENLNIEKQIKALSLINSPKYKKLVTSVALYRGMPASFSEMIDKFNTYDFSRLKKLDSKKIIQEKNNIWHDLLLKYNLSTKNE